MRQQESILEYRGGVYLKLALLVCAAAIAVYAWHDVPSVYRKPYGGTWLGYTLGGVAAFLALVCLVAGASAEAQPGPCIYLATATAGEIAARRLVDHHDARDGPSVSLAGTLPDEIAKGIIYARTSVALKTAAL